MSRWKDESLQLYREECFKQKMPYQYEMAYYEVEGGGHLGNPPALASGTIIYFPDESSNILNFEGINTEYIVFVSKEGVPDADLVSRLISGGNGADIIYCDEDFTEDIYADLEDINEKIRVLRTPWRKPQYSYDTLMSFPYIETCFAIRTAFARSVPAIKKSAEQDDHVRVWDFLLRATERTNRIVRVPQVLYHRNLWKLVSKKKSSAEVSDENIYSALMKKYDEESYRLCREAAQKRRGLNADFSELYDWEKEDIKDREYLVSIIIPSKDHPDMLKDCIRTIRINAGKIPYEIIVVDNGSNEENRKKAARIVENIPRNIGSYIYDNYEFNFSKMCNIGAMEAKAPFLLFLNDDVDAIDDNFLEKLLLYAQMPHVGAVGAKLLYPDGDKIQHVGITDMNRGPTHKLITLSDKKTHYFGRNHYAWNVLAVTGACLMVDREKYFQVGGFSDTMRVSYNDVDLCVKLFENGYLNVVNNECVLIHKESVSRGSDALDYEKNLRLSEERKIFYGAHPWLKAGEDPFLNPYLDGDTIEYKSVAVPDYQITDYRNKTTEMKCPGHESKNVFCSIDRCDIEWGIEEGVEPAYVFDGWGLVNKKDNALYKKYLILIPLDEEGYMLKTGIVAAVCPKYRTDIQEAFPEADNVELAGFECRIPFSKLDANKKYRIGVLVKSRSPLGRYRMTLGDIYEPGRGIITDK